MVLTENDISDLKPQVLEIYRNSISVIRFLSNGIVYITISDHVEIQLEDSKWQYDLLKSKFDGQNGFRVLVEPGEHTSVAKEAREFASTPDKGDVSIGTAVIVKSLAHRLVINFIIKFAYQKSMKMRMFENKEKAEEWLLSL